MYVRFILNYSAIKNNLSHAKKRKVFFRKVIYYLPSSNYNWDFFGICRYNFFINKLTVMKNRLIITTLISLLICTFSFAQVTPTPNSSGAGNCLEFGGINTEFVNCGSNISVDNVFAGGGCTELWIRPNSANISRSFISKIGSTNVGWVFYVSEELAGLCRITFIYTGPRDRNYKSTNRVVTIDEWNHIAVNYNKDNFNNMPSFYVNGVLVSGFEEFNSPNAAMDNDGVQIVNIGNSASSAGNNPFDGRIDEVRIWNRTLTQTQIRNNMCHTLNGTEFGLVGYWQMDAMGSTCGGPTRVCDMTGNGNNGILN